MMIDMLAIFEAVSICGRCQQILGQLQVKKYFGQNCQSKSSMFIADRTTSRDYGLSQIDNHYRKLASRRQSLFVRMENRHKCIIWPYDGSHLFAQQSLRYHVSDHYADVVLDEALVCVGYPGFRRSGPDQFVCLGFIQIRFDDCIFVIRDIPRRIHIPVPICVIVRPVAIIWRRVIGSARHIDLHDFFAHQPRDQHRIGPHFR